MTAVLRWYAQHRENLRALGILAGIALALLAVIYLIPVRAEASPYPPKPQPCVTAPSVCAPTPTGPGVQLFTPSPPVHHLAATGGDYRLPVVMGVFAVVGGAFLLGEVRRRKGSKS